MPRVRRIDPYQLLALSLLGWCLVLLTPTESNAEPPIVSQILIEGNQRVEQDAILFHITQEPDEPLDRDAVDGDIKSIYQMGFFEFVKAKIADIDGEPALVITVKERPQVVSVRIEGMQAFSRTDPRVAKALKLHAGYILNPTAVRETIDNLKSVYKDQGYTDSQITFVPTPRPNNTVISTFKVIETPDVTEAPEH
jgi:outer membrane protein insertion porin family